MLIWTCQSCGREFPAPRSGRNRCLACIVRERKSARMTLVASRPPPRRGVLPNVHGDILAPESDIDPRRRARDRRMVADRRWGADRRVVDISVARDRRHAERRDILERRTGIDRRQAMAASSM